MPHGSTTRHDLPGSAAWIAPRVTDRTADGIARAVGRLIGDGDLEPDRRLPTVREVAGALGVSPTTVSRAWQLLRQEGLVEPRGRLGTVVRRPGAPSGATRFGRMHADARDADLDLSENVPDPYLLPDLGAALASLSHRMEPTSYFEAPVLPRLEELLRADWPYVPGLLTIVDGTMDALDRVLSAHVRPGSRVLVENPTYPPVLDLLELRSAEVVPLAIDERGVRPDSLAAALAPRDADVLVLQPHAQNPTGHSMDADRVRELAALLADSRGLVVEDDHSAGILQADRVSMGTWLPERTVTVRGFSKSYGPDLRIAAVGGATAPLTTLMRRRLLGPAWTSRIVQAVLHHLLTDREAGRAIERARDVYATRRTAMLQALRARGVTASGPDGTNVWVQVGSEQQALVSLALRGIAVAPGSAFQSGPLPSDHVRVACSSLAGQHDRVADAIAALDRLPRRRAL